MRLGRSRRSKEDKKTLLSSSGDFFIYFVTEIRHRKFRPEDLFINEMSLSVQRRDILLHPPFTHLFVRRNEKEPERKKLHLELTCPFPMRLFKCNRK